MTGVKMSDDKKIDNQPTFVVNTDLQASHSEPSLKSRLTKKQLLIGVVSLLITALVVTAVLVAIRIYTDSELDQLELKYSLSMKDKNNKDVQQNVSVDANSVLYEITRDGTHYWILQDFNKGIESVKVESNSGGVTCYLTALNRSAVREPSKIPTTTPTGNTSDTRFVYEVYDSPVVDISFLGVRASKLCDNIPTYWMVPLCDEKSSDSDNNQPTRGRAKRSWLPVIIIIILLLL